MEIERGFTGNTVERTALLLGEEIGELFKAIRKQAGMPIDANSRVRNVEALPAGSYLAMTHLTGGLLPTDVRDDFDAINAQAGIAMRHRSLAEVSRFFTGLTLTEPGIVPINRWRAETEEQPRPSDTDTAVYGALATKP